MFTSRGNICEYAGTRSTSSNVRPSPKNLLGMLVAGDFFIAMGKDREKYIWKRKEGRGTKDRRGRTTEDERRTTKHGPQKMYDG